MAIQIPSESISFASNQAQAALAMRTNMLAMRRLVDAVDLVELEMLVRVLTQVNGRVDIDINTIWLAVLRRHNHAEIAEALVDVDGHFQHNFYANCRQQALTVYWRLETTAAGAGVVEDDLVMYPDNEKELTVVKRRVNSLLRWAAEQMNGAYEYSGYTRPETLLELFSHDIHFSIKRYFASQWFDDLYALGYAVESQPGLGSNAFGERQGRITFIRIITEIINEAVAVFDDTTRPDEERNAYGQRAVLFWPLLKGIVCAATGSENTPLVTADDMLLESISHALREGLRVNNSTDHMDLASHGYSKNGVEAYSTPTDTVIADFLEWVTKSRARSLALRNIR